MHHRDATGETEMLMTDLLARMPDIRGRIEAEHTATPDGRCRDCGTDVWWPCELSQLAHAAEQVKTSALPAPRQHRG